MEERRKHKRLDLEVMVELERLDEESVTTLKYVHVEVTDISRSGLGFKSKADLEIGSYYDTRIQIWTKEVVDAVIEIVRRDALPFHKVGRHTKTFLRVCYFLNFYTFSDAHHQDIS